MYSWDGSFPTELSSRERYRGKITKSWYQERSTCQLHRPEYALPSNELLTSKDHMYSIFVSSVQGIVPDTVNDVEQVGVYKSSEAGGGNGPQVLFDVD